MASRGAGWFLIWSLPPTPVPHPARLHGKVKGKPPSSALGKEGGTPPNKTTRWHPTWGAQNGRPTQGAGLRALQASRGPAQHPFRPETNSDLGTERDLGPAARTPHSPGVLAPPCSVGRAMGSGRPMDDLRGCYLGTASTHPDGTQ